MAFIALPAYNVGNALNFEPLNKAIDGYKEAKYNNALLAMRQGAEARSSEEHEWQRQKFQQNTQDRKSKALGAAAQSLMSMPPDQRGRALQAWRVADKEFDNDLRTAGFDPNDVDTWGPMVIAKARGVQDPLDAEKTRADIDYTRARSEYYRGGGRSSAATSSADERIAERYMSENPELTYMEALDLARTRPADRTRRERLAIEGARGGYAPEEIDPWRERYGVGPNSTTGSRGVTANEQQNALTQPANRFDFSGQMRAQRNGSHQQILQEAREAIGRGVSPEKVRQRLRELGVNETGF